MGALSEFVRNTGSLELRGVCTQVIYFGDHLFSDLKGPAKAGWRTAAVIRELEVLITSL